MSNIRPISDELQQNAIEQLNEVPERMAEDIEALKTWIEKQPHLRARTNDQFLLAFLRGCKFNLEIAKIKIDKYYALRSKYRDFFTVLNMDEAQAIEFLKLGAFVALPTPLHENGARIFVMRPGILPVENLMDSIRISTAMLEITMMEDDYANINGIINISDFSGLSGGHIAQMSPPVMKKLNTYSEEALPLRPKGVYCINMSAVFHSFFKMFLPLMSRKLQERFFIYGPDISELYERVPKNYLPKEYGGENGSIEDIVNKSVEKFLEYRNFFQEERNYGTDEHLRPGGSLDLDEVFGIDGSFKELTVD